MADAPTVLLVDTHEDSRLIYAAALRHFGMDVVPADCTPAVLELARARRPALVVMELTLGASPAWALAATLRRELGTPPVPLVGLGTTGLAEHRDRALAIGCAAFLVKPVPPLDLLQHVRRLLAAAPPA